MASNEELVEADELIALIKAIKFAYPDYGCKRLHDQILTHQGKFAKIPLKRVKKYMQKLGLTQSEAAEVDVEENVDSSNQLKEQAKDAGKKRTIQLMTIGGESKSQRPDHGKESETEVKDSAWLPVKLDEPASKIKKFPYQAVIRMTDSEEGDASGEMGEIYKIQVALGMDGQLSTSDPMLVYNKARDRKTFLHPDSPAYTPVQKLIAGRGLSGAVGGSKAYFWGRYMKENDMLYINTEKLAPFQKW
jgi:hypothetical protein